MTDLISRQAAIDIAMNDRLIINAMDSANDGDIHRTKRAIVRLLASLPSTQPEVICCKDCKWFGNIGCAISIVDDSDKPTGNDFCSFAERRTDETD